MIYQPKSSLNCVRAQYSYLDTSDPLVRSTRAAVTHLKARTLNPQTCTANPTDLSNQTRDTVSERSIGPLLLTTLMYALKTMSHVTT